MSGKEKQLTDLEKVQKFIYSDEVQNYLEEINNILLPINVLKVAGMGDQEIKHSNVLAWIFGANQHQLGHKVLAKFLGEVASIEGDNKGKDDDKLTALRHYAYFPEHERDIDIKREWKNIDLLIEDKSNNVVIVIENKVWASESEHQIADYEKATDGQAYPRKNIGEKSSNGEFENSNTWDVYYIFLTPDGAGVKNSENENWLCANYSIIYSIIQGILKESKQDIPAEARLILDSYNDLLIKENIVANSILQELCAKIWRHNKDALDILVANRPSNISRIAEIIRERLREIRGYDLVAGQNTNTIFRFTTEAIGKKYEGKQKKIYYYLEITEIGLWLGVLMNDIDQEFREQLAKKIKIGRTQKQIAVVTIDNWDMIKYGFTGDDKVIPNQSELEVKLDVIIGEVKKFDQILESALSECA